MDTENSSTPPAEPTGPEPSVPEASSMSESNAGSPQAHGANGQQRQHQGGQGGGRNRRRRGRSRRHGRPGPKGPGQGQGQGQSQGQHAHGGGQPRQYRKQRNQGSGTFTGPMDHSYRQQGDGEINGNLVQQPPRGDRGQRFGRGRFRPFGKPAEFVSGHPVQPVLEPVVRRDDAVRIFAFVEDLFFVSKINETARKLNVRVEFVKSADELEEKIGDAEDAKPSLIIFDLNNANAKPLTAIPKLRARFKKGTSILGFVSHVQGDLKLKAQEAGCDSVVPRSAFSQNLPQILRRHGAPEEEIAG